MPESSPIRVAIIGGTGHLGHALARRLHAAGTDVVVGSRDAARAQEAARSIGLPADAGRSNVEAAGWASVVVVTVPHEAHRQILAAIAPATAGKVVVDTTVPFGRTGEMGLPGGGSAAEEARGLLPAARLVAGFHTVSASMLADLTRPPHGDVLLCGDDPGAKELVAGLVRLLGMRAVDTGKLGQARILEQLVGLLIAINRRYKRRDLGIAIAGLD
jgi:NADPH-dependent F420 reductase